MAASDVSNAILSSLISAACGLIGVLIGGFITSRNQKLERRQRFVREQLTEFYAPLLGIKERIRATVDVRLKIRNAAEGAWQRLMSEAREGGVEHLRETDEHRWPAFERIIEDQNLQLEA